MPANRIILLGGSGTFGRLIADQLAGSGELLIVGRDAAAGSQFAGSIGAGFMACDIHDPGALRSVVRGAQVVINAAGPFQAGHYAVPVSCIAEGCHYLDLADGRRYVEAVGELDRAAKARGVLACVGASTTPAVTHALVAAAAEGLGPIRSIKIALTAGNRNKPGVSTFASILSYAGAPVSVWRGARWQDFPGWSMGESIEFPRIGRRRVQLCDVADLGLFPSRFGAEDVIFKAGVELPLFNYGLWALAQLRRIRPQLKLQALAGPLVSISRWFKTLGSYKGGVAVWVTGVNGETRRLALVTEVNGARIPAAPAVLAARKVLAGAPLPRGAFPCLGFVDVEELLENLAPFGIAKVAGDGRGWGP
jgi:hypothetical protein